jgi:hypothetical protein
VTRHQLITSTQPLDYTLQSSRLLNSRASHRTSQSKMDRSHQSQPGPSRPTRPLGPHHREPSFEFGDFSAAPSSTQSSTLEHGDLLGSFEDLQDIKNDQSDSFPRKPVSREPQRAEADLLADEGWTDFFSQQAITRPPEPHKPMTIDLPPRPDEMPADFVPPPVPPPPRRMSQKRLSFSGPSSPPLISHAGGDIMFRPTPEWHQPKRDATHPPKTSSPPLRSPSQSKLMHTLATTTKIASKWKTVLDPSMFHPPNNHPSRGYSTSSLDLEPPIKSYSDPIEVTHTTPFATAQQIAGSYIAPAGAPSFDSHEKQAVRSYEIVEEKWPDTKLVGRRAGTAEILTPHLADALRRSLPPRQRLSNTWTLLCKLA